MADEHVCLPPSEKMQETSPEAPVESPTVASSAEVSESPEVSRNPLETGTESSGVDKLATLISFPLEATGYLYDSFSISVGFIHHMLENLSILMSAFLFASSSLIQKIDSKVKNNESRDVFNSGLNYIAQKLYEIWLDARAGILRSIDCIANTYEKLIPLLPGDQAWNSIDKKGKTVRELCYLATVSMICRLLMHCKNFLEHSMTIRQDGLNGEAVNISPVSR